MATLTGYLRDNKGVYIEKDPVSILDYSLDWVNYLPSGSSLTSATWNIVAISGDASPLTIDTSAVTSTTKTTANISAGTVGNIYTVECTIVTSDNYTDKRNFRVSVKNRSL